MPRSSPIADLAIPAEPADLRAEVERDPERGAPAIAERLLPTFWAAWGEAADLTEAGLREIVRDYDRELWLWAMGERTWQQCAEGLAGRVRRRL